MVCKTSNKRNRRPQKAYTGQEQLREALWSLDFKAGPYVEDLEMKEKEWRTFPGEPHEER